MNFVCPYCQHAQAVTASNYDRSGHHIHVPAGATATVTIVSVAILCANDACQRLTLRVELYEDREVAGYYRAYEAKPPLAIFKLMPESAAKPQPNCIPEPIREDYYEACRIKDLSPKASATLSRRCLQGMIRDFCKIVEKTLDAEIKALAKMVEDGREPRGVTAESVDAIDAVRRVGNVGAHMEKDINLIIPVDPDEAQLLIDLTESLFEDWYIARERRGARFAAVRELADAKREMQKAPAALPPPDPREEA